MGLNETPRAERLHIGIFGRRNSGKSSLINALTGQDAALVSGAPGTTTDPVYKAMELHPIGPVVFVDTAGFDDEGELGALRVERTEAVLPKVDVAIVVMDASRMEDERGEEATWINKISQRDIPVIIALNKVDLCDDGNSSVDDAHNFVDDAAMSVGVIGASEPPVLVSAATGQGIAQLRDAISRAVPEDYMRRKILGNLVKEDSLVVLVMPQDIQAPKGRLILPQVQTIRELLDGKCTAVATTADRFESTLKLLSRDPDLIITDSQCFKMVHDAKPSGSPLTSFSVLFAAYKGDLSKFLAGASQLDEMTENSMVLIAEACTHVPQSEDIGRVKIPRLLRKKFGDGLKIDNVSGSDFPDLESLEDYDLIVHCGGCMFNRAHIMSRIAEAEQAGVAITNYGVLIAKVNGILDKISLPE